MSCTVPPFHLSHPTQVPERGRVSQTTTPHDQTHAGAPVAKCRAAKWGHKHCQPYRLRQIMRVVLHKESTGCTRRHSSCSDKVPAQQILPAKRPPATLPPRNIQQRAAISQAGHCMTYDPKALPSNEEQHAQQRQMPSPPQPGPTHPPRASEAKLQFTMVCGGLPPQHEGAWGRMRLFLCMKNSITNTRTVEARPRGVMYPPAHRTAGLKTQHAAQ